MKKVLAIFLMCCAVMGAAEPSKAKFGNVQEVLRAAEKTSLDSDRVGIYSELSKQQIRTAEDVASLYAALKDLETRYKNKNQGQIMKAAMGKIHAALAKSTNGPVQPKVAALLEAELSDLPEGYLGPLGAATAEDSDRATLRIARLSALAEAAGDGKNELALPALRKIQEKGGFPAEMAGRAIGKIGKPEDLDRMIEKIKGDPKAKVNLGAFGGAMVDRIMREVENPNIGERQKNELIARLGQAAGPQNLDKYVALLHHSNQKVAKVAARAVASSLRPGDEKIVSKMLTDSDRQIRFAGLVAAGESAWSEAQVSVVVDLLRHDKDEGVREQAAHVLGQKKVFSAEGELRQALSDPSKRVRDAAQGSLDNLSGKYEKVIQERVRRVKARQ